jgi:hypothetical protein
MKNDRLTEDNLGKLDKRIERETELRQKKREILDSRKQGRAYTHTSSRRSNYGNDNDDVMSVKSHASTYSKMSVLSQSSKKSTVNRIKPDK